MEQRTTISVRPVLAMLMVTSLTLLSGYYALFFVGMFAIYLGVTQKKWFKCVLLFLYITILNTIALFPRYLGGYFSSRAANVPQYSFGKNLMSSIYAAAALLKDYYFSIPLLIGLLVLLVYLWVSKNKINISFQPSFLFVAALFYVFIATFLAPYKILRYSMAVYPFFIILPAVLAQSMKNKKVLCFFMIVISLILSGAGLNAKNIQNLYQDKPAKYYFAQEGAGTVFVLCKSFWKYEDLVPYLNDKQTYVFLNSLNDIFKALGGENSCTVIVESTLTSALSLPENLAVVEKNKISGSYFDCLKIRQN
jgi:hypothetical protein